MTAWKHTFCYSNSLFMTLNRARCIRKHTFGRRSCFAERLKDGFLDCLGTVVFGAMVWGRKRV